MGKIEYKKTSLSAEEAAEQLGVNVRTIINYLHSKRLHGNKVGKKWFIDQNSFKKFQGFKNEEIKLKRKEVHLNH